MLPLSRFPMTDLRLPESPSARSFVAVVREHLVLLFGFLGVMWIEEIVDLIPFLDLDQFGIHPRSSWGLAGILFAPFLHGGFEHLAVNTLPFLLLGGLVLLGGVRLFWQVTIFTILMGGFAVWLFAAKWSNHIGASGLIFGYLGFLLARGIFERSVIWILVAGAILVTYGGLLMGLLPFQPGISWEGHLFGFLSGVLVARLLYPRRVGLPVR